MIADELRQRVRELCDRGALEKVRPPGLGSTDERHRRLIELGRRDLSIARMAEPHADARAILFDAGREARTGALYGVWASESPTHQLMLHQVAGRWHLDGAKAFCGGASLCDRALVTADGPDGSSLLVEVDLVHGRGSGSVRVDPSGWSTPAFASTGTATVTFDGYAIPEPGIIGGDRFYLDRPGFWHCAIGPAAVWAGGASAFVEYAEHVVGNRGRGAEHGGAHDRAELGALRALRWAMLVQLESAGTEIDRDPGDLIAARVRALTVRHLVERQASEVLDRFSQTVGPRPFAFDADVVRRHQELQLYLRQCHGAADLEVLGSAATLERGSS